MHQHKVGDEVTFYPAQNEGDNLHFPAVIEEIRGRVKIRVRGKGFPEGGAVKWVSIKRLFRQESLIAA